MHRKNLARHWFCQFFFKKSLKFCTFQKAKSVFLWLVPVKTYSEEPWGSGLTNVLWYFTSLYGSHLWQDQDDINCHKANRCNPTNDRKSRGATERVVKGGNGGNRRKAKSKAGSWKGELGEAGISTESRLNKNIDHRGLQEMFKLHTHISRPIRHALVASNTLFHGLICYSFFIGSAISNPNLGSMLDFRDF